MSLKLEWFGLAEGAVPDARASLTLVGFAPDFLTMPDLPTSLNIFLIIIVQDDENPEPIFSDKEEVKLDARILGPDGQVLGGMQQIANLGPKRYTELPGRVTITMGLRVQLKQYGKHTATMGFSVREAQIKAECDLYIMEK